MTKKDHLSKHVTGSKLSRRTNNDRPMESSDSSSRRTPIHVLTGKKDLARDNPHLPPDAGTHSPMTFFSSSPDVSPKNHGTDSTTRDYRQDLEYLDTSGGGAPYASRRQPSVSGTSAQIAPWVTEGSSIPGAVPSGSFFDDGRGKLPASPSFRPDTGRTGASDSPDPLFFGDERRPSMASATTVSSSNSNRRASTSRSTRHKKLANFFGEDGHESSRGSDTSVLTTGRDHSTSSHSHKDRNNSVHTINTDGRPISPTNSRPRTPLPSSEVTPWLFQDFKFQWEDRTSSPSESCRQTCQAAISIMESKMKYL